MTAGLIYVIIKNTGILTIMCPGDSMLRTSEIHIRDPFVLVHGGKYYLYGSRGDETWGHCTGLDVYVGTDLENWEGPINCFTPPEGFWSDFNFWAPEVHFVNGKFRMFVSFKSETRHRGTQILVSDTPTGNFVPMTDYPVTPADWECLDGTLYTDPEGKHSIVFCREWTQVGNGEICAMPLSDDLTAPAGEPCVLFRAGDTGWSRSVTGTPRDLVTDGPFLYTAGSGRLIMLWSGYSENGYAVAAAYSADGGLYGGWTHDPNLICDRNGGHGMLFRALSGELMFVMHSPNTVGAERPLFVHAADTGDSVILLDR